LKIPASSVIEPSSPINLNGFKVMPLANGEVSWVVSRV